MHQQTRSMKSCWKSSLRMSSSTISCWKIHKYVKNVVYYFLSRLLFILFKCRLPRRRCPTSNVVVYERVFFIVKSNTGTNMDLDSPIERFKILFIQFECFPCTFDNGRWVNILYPLEPIYPHLNACFRPLPSLWKFSYSYPIKYDPLLNILLFRLN